MLVLTVQTKRKSSRFSPKIGIKAKYDVSCGHWE